MKRNLLVALWASAVVGCDSTRAVVQPVEQDARPVFVVSNPSIRITQGQTIAANGAERLVFISLPPGTIPNGASAAIHGYNAVATRVSMTDGGFDPVAVPANVGDTITVTVSVTQSTGPLVFSFVVPLNARPKVVRTNPPKLKRDVPLNARPIAIFSEPIDSASLTNGSIKLRRGGVDVAGQVSFGDLEHTSIEFTPTGELSSSTDYDLIITQGVRDLDGATLDSAVTVRFTSAATSTVPADGLTVLRTVPVQDEQVVMAPGEVFTVWFSEAVKWSSLNATGAATQSRVQMFAGTDTVAGSLGCYGIGTSGTCQSVSFVPTLPLPEGVTYRVAIGVGIEGASGKILSTPYTTSFTTTKPADDPAGPTSSQIVIYSFQMIEFQYQQTGGMYFYAPLLGVGAVGGKAVLTKMVFTIPGLPGPIPSVCAGLTIPAGAGFDLFTEIYGDYQITFSSSTGTRAMDGASATVEIWFRDAEGRQGKTKGQTPVVHGTLPNTYTGGNPPLSYGIGC